MKVKKFEEFINETYLDSNINPKYLDYDFKKMKKNGYIQVKILKDIEDSKKGDILMTSSNEFGTLDDDSLVTCYNKNGDKIMVIKSDLEVKK